MEKYDSIPSLGEQQTSSRVFTVLVIFAEMLALAVVIMIGIWMGNFRGGFAWHDKVAIEFNYHPLFMTLGLVFLYGNAMLVFRVFRNERKMRLKIAHSVLQALALIISAVGLKAVFDSHNLAPTPHANLFTLHSWIGIVTVILFGIQWLVGLLSFLLPFCGQSFRAFVLPIHTFFGVVIFCFAIATALMGITEKLIQMEDYSEFVTEGVMVNTAGVLMVSLAVVVGFLVTNPNFKRQPLPEEENIPLTN